MEDFKKDIQQLLNKTFPFVDQLLIEDGEFYPAGNFIDSEGTISMLNPFAGDDFPLSDIVIKNLKQKAKEIKDLEAVVIFYDALVSTESDALKRNAVAVFAEHIRSESAFLYFFPYQVCNSTIEYYESWTEQIPKEIFTDIQ